MQDNVAFFRRIIRILFIIRFCSEPFHSEEYPARKRVLHSEVKIQKIEFWIRYPDYLCLELLDLIPHMDKSQQKVILDHVERILNSEEPLLIAEDMQRYIYGAFENMDREISFLLSRKIIDWDYGGRTIDNKQTNKRYFITQKGIDLINIGYVKLPKVRWYNERVNLINTYFGKFNGTYLKNLQYANEEYRKEQILNKIPRIYEKVREEFKHRLSI